GHADDGREHSPADDQEEQTAAPSSKSVVTDLSHGFLLTVYTCDSTSVKMPHRIVAAQTGELPAGRRRVRRLDGADNLAVAVTAGLLGDHAAVRLDLNVILVAAGGEKKRMPEAVRRLGRILARETGGSVAAIAGRHRAVRRLEPAVELLPHDVAVGAGGRIVSE